MSGRRAIKLVARREIRERLRSRAFMASTAIMLILVAASTAASALVNPEKTYRIAVAEPAQAGLTAALERAAAPFDAKVRVQTVDSVAAGRELLRAKKADALLLLGESRLVFRQNVDAKVAAAADGAVRALRRHLPPAPELTTATLEPPKAENTDAEILVAVIGSMVLFLSILMYGQWVLVGVVEEKSNRVVELVLSTLRPRHLLAGKVIGIGLLGLAQLALVAGLTAGLFTAGLFDAPASLGANVLLIVPWFALGFALYAVAYAAAGALASRQQDASSAGQPVAFTLGLGYILSYAVVSADPESLLSHLLTVFPVTSAAVLPARSALGDVPLWEHALALVAMLASIYALVRLAGRVYERALLRSGPRLDLRAAWRLARQTS